MTQSRSAPSCAPKRTTRTAFSAVCPAHEQARESGSRMERGALRQRELPHLGHHEPGGSGVNRHSRRTSAGGRSPTPSSSPGTRASARRIAFIPQMRTNFNAHAHKSRQISCALRRARRPLCALLPAQRVPHGRPAPPSRGASTAPCCAAQCAECRRCGSSPPQPGCPLGRSCQTAAWCRPPSPR